MCLHVHSDALYLYVSNTRSRTGVGFVFLSQNPIPRKILTQYPINNPVHVICIILKFVMDLTAETEIGTCYMTVQDNTPIIIF